MGVGGGRGVGLVVGAYLRLSGRGRGWAPILGWALIKFFRLLDGCLLEVSAN